MNWSDIEGWTEGTEQWLRGVAETFPDGGTYIEVGVWFGRSLGALGTFLRDRGKTARLIGVDTFVSMPHFTPEMKARVNECGGSILVQTKKNLEALGVAVDLFQKTSSDAAEDFAPESVDYVFIDADHSYEAVTRDIEAWWPKVKKGGWLAGHDFDQEPVAHAVLHKFPTAGNGGKVWFVQKAAE